MTYGCGHNFVESVLNQTYFLAVFFGAAFFAEADLQEVDFAEEDFEQQHLPPFSCSTAIIQNFSS